MSDVDYDDDEPLTDDTGDAADNSQTQSNLTAELRRQYALRRRIEEWQDQRAFRASLDYLDLPLDRDLDLPTERDEDRVPG